MIDNQAGSDRNFFFAACACGSGNATEKCVRGSFVVILASNFQPSTLRCHLTSLRDATSIKSIMVESYESPKYVRYNHQRRLCRSAIIQTV